MDSHTSSGISKYIQKYHDVNTRGGKDLKHCWMCQNRLGFIMPGIDFKWILNTLGVVINGLELFKTTFKMIQILQKP